MDQVGLIAGQDVLRGVVLIVMNGAIATVVALALRGVICNVHQVADRVAIIAEADALHVEAHVTHTVAANV